MTSQVDQIAHSAVGESLENLAFMEVLPASERFQPVAGQTVLVRQRVLGPVQGEFLLLMPRHLVAMIAATIFISDSGEVSEQDQDDVANELLNTIVGKFLNDFLPQDETYKLGLPVLETVEEVSRRQGVKEWSFLTENELFALLVSEDLLVTVRRR